MSVVYFRGPLQADMVVAVIDRVDVDWGATASDREELVICVLDAKSVGDVPFCPAPAATSSGLHDEPIVASREQIAWFPHSSVQ